MKRIYYLGCLLICCSFLLAFSGCSTAESKEAELIKGTIRRYNQLLIEGYKRMNMNPLQEVTTPEQAEKLYFHMAALGEGRLRLDSTLKEISFTSVDMSKPGEATAVTRETWDFTHVNLNTGGKFSEEKDFIYEMRYTLKSRDGRWLITSVSTLGGRSTNTVIPWPEIDRRGNVKGAGPAGKGAEMPAKGP
ncbi:hypothetical protein [Geobacter sp.]|uniref:hypothetical protein n=1 Tax=Geobacter sp. TaxID=46610 RepID=UPI002604190C|nr:hypothetical protein [Geobacter sp.]